MKKLIIIFFLFGCVKASMFTGAPTHASGLRSSGIGLISKYDISVRWIAKTFNIKKTVIAETIYNSILNTPGNCPCPYNLMSNGNRCGGTSAYSRPGGYEPMCYPADTKLHTRNK